MKTNVCIVGQSSTAREALRFVLSKETGIEVVAEADNAGMALKLNEEHKPHVVLLDVPMTEQQGMEGIRLLAGTGSGTRIIALSMVATTRFMVDALKAGAHGCLLKESVSEELAEAVRAVTCGRVYLSCGITGVDLGNPAKLDASRSPSTLTSREKEVLRLLAEGNNTKEMAFLLLVSPKTIETHCMRIKRKLNIFSVAGLTRYALREGMTGFD